MFARRRLWLAGFAPRRRGRNARRGSRPPRTPTPGLWKSDLAEVLGLEVEILDAGGAGELRILYTTLEQLDDLCRRLTRRGRGRVARFNGS